VTILVPKFVQLVIDRIIPHQDTRLFVQLLVLLAVSIAVMLLSNAWKNRLAQHFQEKALFDLKQGVFRKIRELGFEYFEKHPAGEMMSYFNTDIPAIEDVYRNHIPRIAELVCTHTISLVFLVFVNWKLALLFIPCAFFYVLTGPFFEKRGVRYIQEHTYWAKEIDKKQYDSLASLLELRAYGAEEWDLSKLGSMSLRASKAMQLHFVFINLYAVMRRIAVYAGAALLFWYGFQQVEAHAISTGSFTAFILLYFQLMFGITFLVTRLSQQSVKIRGAEKLYRFMQQHPVVSESKHPVVLSEIRGKVEFVNVRFAYQDTRNVLNDVTFTAEPGERICLVGGSGGGKSTVAKLLGRFYDVGGGEIRLDGVPVHQLSFAQLREAIGYVFQETYLFGASVRDNIRFGRPDASDEEVELAAKSANAHGFITELPQGYDTLIGERGNKLSGGQKQRIALARMFVKNPAIVLLDEATSALDNISEKEVNAAIERLLEGRTTICIAHRSSTIRNYKRILLLDEGKVVHDGSYDQLMERHGKLYESIQVNEGMQNEA
jgi:ATP-binding cassette subfamily B protein/subfamily B ATP-binding cassette protein MsbA